MHWQALSAGERPKLNFHVARGHRPWQERPVIGAVLTSPQTAMGEEERTAWSTVHPCQHIVDLSESGAMTTDDYVVVIVDDDLRVREALSELLETHGIRAVAYGSAGEYVRAGKLDSPATLILDVELPDINGLDLQKQIADGDHPPVIFITGHGDIPSSVRAIKHGAVDFLTKPFSDDDLMRAVQTGLAQDRRARAERAEMAAIRDRYAKLTPRERDVLPLVVSGLLNKQAAAQLGISEVTLQIHRRNIMQKMATASLADLVRIAQRLGIPITHSRRAGGTEGA
jgi:FixJ family two-component response regulator